MKIQRKGEDPWQYGTFEGAERLLHQQTAIMTFPERLQALDDMITLAGELHPAKRKDFNILTFTKHPDGEQRQRG